MTEKWWPEDLDDWAQDIVITEMGDQIMKYLGAKYQGAWGLSLGTAKDCALLYWTKEITRQIAEVWSLPVPGYALKEE